MTSREKILGPAIRVINDNCVQAKIYTLPIPFSHKDIDLEGIKANNTKVIDVDIEYTIGIRMTDGFYTNKRVFISRYDAMLVAKEANQIKHPWLDNGLHLFTNNLKGY